MTVDQYHKRSIRIYLIPLNRVDLTAVPWTVTCYRIPVTPVALAVLQVIKLHLCIVNFRRLFIVSYLTACIINLRTVSNKCEMKDSGADNVPTSHLRYEKRPLLEPSLCFCEVLIQGVKLLSSALLWSPPHLSPMTEMTWFSGPAEELMDSLLRNVNKHSLLYVSLLVLIFFFFFSFFFPLPPATNTALTLSLVSPPALHAEVMAELTSAFQFQAKLNPQL